MSNFWTIRAHEPYKFPSWEYILFLLIQFDIYCANLDLARSFLPNLYISNVPIIPITLSPAKTVTPLCTPKLINIGLAARMHPEAMADLIKSLPVKIEAAYWGYETGTYMKRPWMTQYWPTTKIATPISGTIQWILARAVQANMKSPTGITKDPKMAGSKRCSCSRNPFLMLSGII